MLFSTAYFPPLSYVAAIAEGFILSDDGVKPSCVWIDAGEHYVKQTWRNRCRIASAAWTEDLRVPVVHAGGGKVPVGQVRVDYSTPWVTRTLRAIDAAYCSSAFYLYYYDEMAAILASKFETLLELNTALLRFFLNKIGIPADVRMTPHYVQPGDLSFGEDFRERIHPKRPDTLLQERGLEKPYFQVFAQKYGFQPNLSVMDLLFNEGPDSMLYLRRR